MNIRRAGDRAILIETDTPAHRLHAAIRAEAIPEVLDVVPAERTVLVTTVPGADLGRLAGKIRVLSGSLCSLRAEHDLLESFKELIEIGVVYDGADLPEVAALTGLSVDEVIARHCDRRYTVAYLGYAPGFGYLTGLDETLRVPRRDTPRTGVPAGAVAIAGEYTAVYPMRSPGGWRLIGRAEVALWDLDRDPPALFYPGAEVRFVRRG